MVNNDIRKMAYSSLRLEYSDFNHETQIKAFNQGFKDAVKLLEDKLAEGQQLSHILWELNILLDGNNENRKTF